MSRHPRPPRWEGKDKAGDLGEDPELQPEVYEEQASRQPQLIPFLFAWTQPDDIKGRADYLARLPPDSARRSPEVDGEPPGSRG